MSGFCECPKCSGVGEVGFRPPNWGSIDAPFDYDTRLCDLCGGIGEVKADDAMAYLEKVTAP